MNYSAEYVRDLELQNATLLKLLKRANKKVDEQLEEIDTVNCIKDYVENQLKEVLACRVRNCCKSVHACDDLHKECGWCKCCDEYKQKWDRITDELIGLGSREEPEPESESDEDEPEPVKKPVRKQPVRK